MVTRAATVSVPGKTIVLGEHAAVYGYPALVAAKDLRLRVRVRPAERWTIDLSDQAASGESDLTEHAVEVARRRLLEDATIGAASDLALDVEVRSSIPVGCGMGSSAALGVGIAAALREAAGGDREPAWVDATAYEVEKRQHGRPSGIDNQTVRRGGLLSIVRRADAQLEVQELVPPDWLSSIRSFNTGRPRESTGAVVGAVAQRREESPALIEAALQRLGQLARELAASTIDVGDAIEIVRSSQRQLEVLGIVPAAVASVVRDVEALGGAAKISGAGALSGTAAGQLLTLHRDPSVLSEAPSLQTLEELPGTLGATGLRYEDPMPGGS